MAVGIQKDWSGEHNAFRRFLNWLDQGDDSGGQRYLEIRHRLVQYFDRKNCASPDELADETLQRVARRLSEEGEIRDASPAHYCYIVAKFVFLEYRRFPGRSQVSLEAIPARNVSMPQTVPGAEEQMWDGRESSTQTGTQKIAYSTNPGDLLFDLAHQAVSATNGHA